MSAVFPSPIFPDLDPDAVEDLSTRLLQALVAVVEFARPAEGDDHKLFEAAIAEALVMSLATWIAHPHQDEEQHAELLDKVVAAVRAQVAEIGRAD